MKKYSVIIRKTSKIYKTNITKKEKTKKNTICHISQHC